MVQDGPGQKQLMKVDCSDLNSFACTKTEGNVINSFQEYVINLNYTK